ncbi:MAG: hypothetical protein ACI4R9_03840 [Kiritimatiellia bacterium]
MIVMKGKSITIILLCATVLASAVAGVVCMNKREAAARAARDRAEAAADAAREAARKAEADQATAEAKLALEKKAAATAEENRRAAETKLESDREQRRLAEEKKAAAEVERDRAKAAAQEAADRKAAEKAREAAAQLALETAKAEAQKAALAAQAAADALAREKAIADRTVAEAKLLELKRIDFETLERDLLDFKRDLDAREAALRPEKTVKDLVTTGTAAEEVKEPEGPPLPENDMSLSRGARALARAERLRDERTAQRLAACKAETIRALERLYVSSIRADRMTDADFYRTTLKNLYPDWEYRLPQKEKEEEQ